MATTKDANSIIFHHGIQNKAGTSCHIGSIIQFIHHGMPDISNAIVEVANIYYNEQQQKQIKTLETNNSISNLKDDSENDNMDHSSIHQKQQFIIEFGRLLQSLSRPIINEKQNTEMKSSTETETKMNDIIKNKLSHNTLDSIDPKIFYNIIMSPPISLNPNKMGDASTALRILLQNLYSITDHMIIYLENDITSSTNSSRKKYSVWNNLKQTLDEGLSGKYMKQVQGISKKWAQKYMKNNRNADSNKDDDSSNESIKPDYRQSTTIRDFHVPILLPLQKNQTLISSMKTFTSPQLLKGYNWSLSSDEQTNTSYRTTQTTTFHTLPKYLLLQLQRFQFNPNTFSVKKVLHEIDIPHIFNIKPFLSSPNHHFPFNKRDINLRRDKKSSSIYHLNGIVFHEGQTADDGHFYTFMKQNSSNDCNDTKSTNNHNNSHHYSDTSNTNQDSSQPMHWILYNDEYVYQLKSPTPTPTTFKTSMNDTTNVNTNSFPKIPLLFWDQVHVNRNENINHSNPKHHIPKCIGHETILLYTRSNDQPYDDSSYDSSSQTSSSFTDSSGDSSDDSSVNTTDDATDDTTDDITDDITDKSSDSSDDSTNESKRNPPEDSL